MSGPDAGPELRKRKPYEALEPMQHTLVAMARWLQRGGQRLMVPERRDTAGEIVLFDRSWYSRTGVDYDALAPLAPLEA